MILAGILSLIDWFKKHQIHFPNPYGHKSWHSSLKFMVNEENSGRVGGGGGGGGK